MAMGEAALDEGLVTDEMRAMIGRVLQSRTSYPISAADIRKWAIAVYYPEEPPAKFLGPGAAGGGEPLIAPEEFNPFAWGGPEGPPKDVVYDAGWLERRAGVTPPDVKVVLNGGSDCEYGAPMREGDVIRAASTLKGYTVKRGKAGPLLITQSQDQWTNQRGEVVKTTVSAILRY
jgi:hypothetical protein